MRVNFLDHVNIIADDMVAAARFYSELLGLDVRNGPPPTAPDQVLWVYDDGGRAIIHLNAPQAFQVFPRDARPGAATGAVHHVAFNCQGHAEMIERLKRHGIAHQQNSVDSIGLKQVFCTDPSGVLLELNFFAD